MTVIRPNSVSGITSITAQANEINVFRSDGALAGLQLNGVNFNTTAGVSTFATLNVTTVSIGGTLTYEDVTNVDSVGIITARTGIKVLGGGINAVGVVTATSFSGSGANLTGVLKNVVEDTSPQLGGALDTNGNNINVNSAVKFADNIQANFGTGDDSAVRFNGTDLVITTAGKIKSYAGSTGFEFYSNDNSETFAKFIKNGAVELFHDNHKVFETTAAGTKVGRTNGSNSYIEIINSGGTAGFLYGASNNEMQIMDREGHAFFKGIKDGAVELYHDNDKKFMTQSDGVRIEDGGRLYFQNGSENASSAIYNGSGSGTSDLQFRTNGTHRVTLNYDGHFEPALNNTYDLGTSSYRWRNIYTNDLNLSNEGSSNSVDNTWGNYTIQEGESDLYLINNRNGKKYKFNLTEVS